MNNQSPLVPQGSLSEQNNQGRNRVKIAVFFVLALHAVVVLALLMQVGCKEKSKESTQDTTTPPATADAAPSNAAPAFDSPTPTASDTNTGSGLATTPTGGSTTAAVPLYVPPQAQQVPQAQQAQQVPPTLPTLPTVPTSTGNDYKIAKGDTLGKIATRNHVTLKALQEANPGVDSTKLHPGQTIHLPSASATTTSLPVPGSGVGTAPGTETSAAGQTYTVKSGDNLIKVASQFGVKVKALRSANHLKTDRIKVGDKLTIPAKATASAMPTPAPTASVPMPPEASAPAMPVTPVTPVPAGR
jgi:LysM repeat protein